MIYIINTTDPEKKAYLEDFLHDNNLFFETTEKSRIKKISIDIRSEVDYTNNIDIGDIGMLNIKLEAIGDKTIELRHYGYNCMYPQRKIRKLPKEFIRERETSKCNGAQYWGSSIQVYHANDGIPFIYEPIKL